MTEQDPRVVILAEVLADLTAGWTQAKGVTWGSFAADLLSRLDAARPASPTPEHEGAGVLARMANGYYNIAGGFQRAGDQTMANWALAVSSEAAREAVRLDPSLGDALTAAVNGAPALERATPNREALVQAFARADVFYDHHKTNGQEWHPPMRCEAERMADVVLAASPAPVAPGPEENQVPLAALAGRATRIADDLLHEYGEDRHKLSGEVVAIRDGLRAHRCGLPATQAVRLALEDAYRAGARGETSFDQFAVADRIASTTGEASDADLA